MACSSGSVQKVADKTVAARDQIDKLQKMIESQDKDFKDKFTVEIDKRLAEANITDARVIGFNSDIKTEYTSEFSLDKIAAVVTSTLKAAAAATDKDVPNPATSKEAIDAYTDVVNTVAEAAKSSSTAAASLSFSMNRLSPGFFAFLQATSINILDNDTFGSEAVTTTAIYYKLIQSIDDVKSQSKFNSAIIDAKNLLNMKKIQAALIDSLGRGEIDIDTWTKKDAEYTRVIANMQARLNDDKLKTAQAKGLLVEAHSNQSASTLTLITELVNQLSGMGASYQVAIDKSLQRIADGYY